MKQACYALVTGASRGIGNYFARALAARSWNVIVVARSKGQIERLADAGVDGVLVGEALMRAPDVEGACRELTGVAA